MNGPDPRRREALLVLAEQLSKRLRSAEVPYLAGRTAPSRGVPQSALAHVTSYLARVRDLVRLREFLGRIEQLDAIAAQNLANPKADHRVLREELEGLLSEHPDLTAEELLYTLAWCRRLLPKAGVPSANAGRGRRGPEAAGRAGPVRGGQLAAALGRAQRKADRKRREPSPDGDNR